MIKRYKMVVSYNGKGYKGWAKQPKEMTIQGEIEEKLSQILNKRIDIYGSGRTDAGVHALNQVCHFDAEVKDLGRLKYSLNKMLGEYIHIKSITKVSSTFSSRMDAKKKEYRYQINMGEPTPFDEDFYYQTKVKLDVDKMNIAIKDIIGTHRYACFTSKEEDEDNFVRTIYEATIKRKGNKLLVTFIGNGFMRYEVRMLVGSLVQIGLGKEDINYLKNNIDKEKRVVTSYKAPAKGLFLVKVEY